MSSMQAINSAHDNSTLGSGYLMSKIQSKITWPELQIDKENIYGVTIKYVILHKNIKIKQITYYIKI